MRKAQDGVGVVKINLSRIRDMALFLVRVCMLWSFRASLPDSVDVSANSNHRPSPTRHNYGQQIRHFWGAQLFPPHVSSRLGQTHLYGSLLSDERTQSAFPVL